MTSAPLASPWKAHPAEPGRSAYSRADRRRPETDAHSPVALFSIRETRARRYTARPSCQSNSVKLSLRRGRDKACDVFLFRNVTN